MVRKYEGPILAVCGPQFIKLPETVAVMLLPQGKNYGPGLVTTGHSAGLSLQIFRPRP